MHRGEQFHGVNLSPILVLSEGLRPSDSPARALARRFAGSLRSRGSLAVAREHLSPHAIRAAEAVPTPSVRCVSRPRIPAGAGREALTLNSLTRFHRRFRLDPWHAKPFKAPCDRHG